MNALASELSRLEEAARRLERALARLEAAVGRQRGRFREAPKMAGEIGAHVDAALAEIERLLAGES